jgi:5'-methylthioadenosine phosphorylase
MVGLIGGYNLYNILREKKWKKIKTKYGEPSSRVAIGKIHGKKVALILRHGENHTIPPHKINHQANIKAFYDLGVKNIIAISRVGIINPRIKVGDLILPDDFIDFRFQPTTFFDNFAKEAKHALMISPYSTRLRNFIKNSAQKMKIKIHSRGVYANTLGPRFETQVELKILKKMGADMVGMTNVPEVVLANELEIEIAAIAQGVNPTIGARPIDFKKFSSIIKNNAKQLRALIKETIQLL